MCSFKSGITLNFKPSNEQKKRKKCTNKFAFYLFCAMFYTCVCVYIYMCVCVCTHTFSSVVLKGNFGRVYPTQNIIFMSLSIYWYTHTVTIYQRGAFLARKIVFFQTDQKYILSSKNCPCLPRFAVFGPAFQTPHPPHNSQCHLTSLTTSIFISY